MNIARQQDDFIQGIFHPEKAIAPDQDAFRVYQRNLLASARRALEINYPTVKQLIGDEMFGYVSDSLLYQNPPQCADWGEWGELLPAILRSNDNLDEYPYIPDCARLDHLLHQSERAENAEFNMASLGLLEATCLNGIGLTFSPSTFLLDSSYPLIEIFKSHEESGDLYLRKAQEKLQQKNFHQYILVTRPRFKAQFQALTEAEHTWFHHVLSGHSIGRSLDLIEGETFDFTAWLPKLVKTHTITKLNRHTEKQEASL